MDEKSKFNAGMLVSVHVAGLFIDAIKAYMNNDARQYVLIIDRLAIVLSPYMDNNETDAIDYYLNIVYSEMEKLDQYRRLNPSDVPIIPKSLYTPLKDLEIILRAVWKKSGLMSIHEISENDDFQ